MGEILLLILIGLSIGALLGINRALIGRLGSDLGPPKASIINHAGGLIFMILILVIRDGELRYEEYWDAPLYTYWGGIVGACFVAIISWIIPKLGVMQTSLLLISGQMFMSFVIDLVSGKIHSITTGIIGLALILAGVFIRELFKA